MQFGSSRKIRSLVSAGSLTLVAMSGLAGASAVASPATITLHRVAAQPVDSPFSLEGRISGTGRRNDKVVVLQRQKGATWVRVARLVRQDDGHYSFAPRSYALPGTRTFRTVVKRSGRALDVSPARAVVIEGESPAPPPPVPTPTPTPPPPPPPTPPGTTVVSLTFDDTLANQATALAVLQEHGMRSTIYVNSPRIGTRNYLSKAQLDSFVAAGHEVGGHTLTHPDLTAVSADEARRQICDDRVDLLALGYPVTSFANPLGATNAAVQQIIRDCGYNSARGVSGLRSPGIGCTACPTAETVPPADPWEIRTPVSVQSSTSLQMLKDYVTSAEDDAGGWVPLLFHGVCDGCAPNAVSPAVFRAFVEWLSTRPATTQVRTVHEVIGGAVRPGVPFVPPATHATSVTIGAQSHPVDGTDSYRAANMLIRYTPATGATTGTNSSGTEVAVVDGVVTQVQSGVGNMAIPPDGFVLSGHGAAHTWLSSNAVVGSSVRLSFGPSS
jgi:peptidoglycan/xylan/chitin deacetylase (PgdA/CDA1 family)